MQQKLFYVPFVVSRYRIKASIEKANTSEIVTYNSVLDDMGEQQLTLF